MSIPTLTGVIVLPGQLACPHTDAFQALQEQLGPGKVQLYADVLARGKDSRQTHTGFGFGADCAAQYDADDDEVSLARTGDRLRCLH